MFQRILLAIDSSTARRRTEEAAAFLASLFGATVRVLHVEAMAAAGAAALPLEDDRAANEVLDDALTALGAAGVRADSELLRGFTTEVPALISSAARRYDADLLVLGTHHRGVLANLFNPRVSDTVNHTTRIPVLLMPDPESAEPEPAST